LVWSGEGGLRLHASAQHAFRRPTLNELYRPFRVGNVITDANPQLRTETITSGELGAGWAHGPLDFDVTAFLNDLHDAVGNVTIAHGPGTFPGIGFVPAGGEGRRRLNLDRARVQGASVAVRWELAPNLKARLQYLYDDATVRRATVSPGLEGLRLAQVPRHSASSGLDWKQGIWTVSPEVRFVGEQFEDDGNTLPLAPATLVDLAVHVRIDPHAELFVTAENIADHRLETGRSADDLVNIGSPRLILFGIRSSW
jgi:outer membrane receptor protein involved in Fe transport